MHWVDDWGGRVADAQIERLEERVFKDVPAESDAAAA
jgi:hypothetical protein